MSQTQQQTAASPRLDYPKFTREMRVTHKILIPQMLPIHFSLIEKVLRQEGYDVEVLKNDGPSVVQTGLKYVHNDTCYPALLVIGQMIDALNSGKYDLEHTALMITQTGGGCRASNYIHLLRKALKKAGYGQVPVVSLNFSGLEKDSGFQLTLPLIEKVLGAVFYGDMLMLLSNQLRPYEDRRGDADRLVNYWVAMLSDQFATGHGCSKREMARNFDAIAKTFADLHVTRTPKVKVGVVGEIYIKYSPLGNNQLERFLAGEDCEVNVPGLLGFVLYCVVNGAETIDLYGGSRAAKSVYKLVMEYFARRERMMIAAISKYPGLTPPPLFSATMKCADGIIGYGNKMGEGWLLTAEMMELEQHGVDNIICAQPFGCLPNHICGKGMMNRIRSVYPDANIVAIDYDPSATRVNQENRIKLMLSVARERLDQNPPPAPKSHGAAAPAADRYAPFGNPAPAPAKI
ncbi:2-hydroxyacyl-CoA dehydratase [Anaerofilum sp. BX8]|uniref:2-hydroxyacyl-CoA dehydratase n=1 Tax=Anaerofilum hominis TaxID=2763016 RepID=A0A923L152_9FIRM|nr:2-hydroxyacyl-CoA dehydratase [Anaerofilum hominis]MBC5580673.1 2-hydroxyacyl-CoA dehydratase [Anaerofilum hominis]